MHWTVVTQERSGSVYCHDLIHSLQRDGIVKKKRGWVGMWEDCVEVDFGFWSFLLSVFSCQQFRCVANLNLELLTKKVLDQSTTTQFLSPYLWGKVHIDTKKKHNNTFLCKLYHANIYCLSRYESYFMVKYELSQRWWEYRF